MEIPLEKIRAGHKLLEEAGYPVSEREFESNICYATGRPEGSPALSALIEFDERLDTLEDAVSAYKKAGADLENVEAKVAAVKEPPTPPKLIEERERLQTEYETSRLALIQARKAYVEGYAGPNGVRAKVQEDKLAGVTPPVAVAIPVATPVPVPVSTPPKAVVGKPPVSPALPGKATVRANGDKGEGVRREEPVPAPAVHTPEKETVVVPEKKVPVREERRSSPWSWVLGVAAIVVLLIIAVFFVKWYQTDNAKANLEAVRVQIEDKRSEVIDQQALEKAYGDGVHDQQQTDEHKKLELRREGRQQ